MEANPATGPGPSSAPASDRPPGRRRRQLIPKLILLLVSCSFCLLGMEFGVRCFCPYFSPRGQIQLGMVTNGVALGVPGARVRQATPKGDYDLMVQFNEDGFRDDKNLRDSLESDWFAVGDSFTLGWGVPDGERYSDRLQQAFRTNGIQARVYNIAVPENIIGYQRLVKYAESRGARIRHLVVGLCMENDLCDYRSGQSGHEADHAPVDRRAQRPSMKAVARNWLLDHSALYIACSFTLQKFTVTRWLFHKLGIARSVSQLSPKNEWNEAVLRSVRDEMVKLVSGRDAVVLIIPSRRLWAWEGQATERRIHDALIPMLREAGLTVVDARTAFEAEGDPLSLYFKTDPHWTARGHAVAARELFNGIQARADRK